MKKIEKMLSVFVENLVSRLSFVFLMLMVVLNVAGLFMDGVTWSVLHMILCAIFSGICYFIVKSGLWKRKWFWGAIICIGIGARIVYALTVHVPIRSDPLKCLEAAQSLVEGDLSWTEDMYFQKWAYQIPFVVYEAFVLKVFGSVSALYVLNLLGSIAVCALLFLIVREATEDCLTALVVTAMYAIAPAYVMHQGILYNNILGG